MKKILVLKKKWLRDQFNRFHRRGVGQKELDKKRVEEFVKRGGRGRRSEMVFARKMRRHGYEVFRAGWPDYLVVDPKKPGVIFVECKWGRQIQISNIQKEMLSVLKYVLGLDVRIYDGSRGYWRKFK